MILSTNEIKLQTYYKAAHSCAQPKNIFIKAELLQLKPHPFICVRNFINKKVVNQIRPTFKTDIIKVGLLFSISNFFNNKISHANKWMRF